jgi:hypothetical protein
MDRASIALFSILVLASCGRSGTPINDKAYFTAHPEARIQTLLDCRNDPGGLGAGANCINAAQSDADAEHERVFHGAASRPSGVTNANHL